MMITAIIVAVKYKIGERSRFWSTPAIALVARVVERMAGALPLIR